MKNLNLNTLLTITAITMLSSCGGKSTSSSSKETLSSSIEAVSSIESSSSEESSEESYLKDDEDFITNEAAFMKPTLLDGAFVPKKDATFEYGYFTDQPQIIYMELGVALDYVYGKEVAPTYSNGVFTYDCPLGAKYIIDPTKDTVTLHNYDKGCMFPMRYDVPLGLIDSGIAAKIVDNSKSAFHEAEDVVLDLASYSLDVVHYQGEAYLPFFLVDQLIFSTNFYSSVSFNGTSFYLLDLANGAMGLNPANNPYTTSYYSGKNGETEKEDYFTFFNAKAFFFQLDHFFGFQDERFVPFENYLEKNHPQVYEDLFSKSEDTYNNAVTYVLETIIGDGHTNSRTATSSYGGGHTDVTIIKSDRSAKLSENRAALVAKRNEANVYPNAVRFSGDTAILSFDGFSHCGVELTAENISEYSKGNNDTFALALVAMNEIKAHGDIKNVIFDVSCNGGGDTNALFPMLGLMQREFKDISYNPLSKAYNVLDYQIDTNFDGKFDDNDGYQGQYQFYILTSNYSFSCANMFPFVAKENGFAKIIGEQSGGGACTVAYTSTADGKPFRMSGLSRSGYLSSPSKHDDDGVPVDVVLERDHFYDDAYLNTFVNSL